jgi:anaerobic magnesium-protoporphyrin IX monomethyl ester cyclase
MNTLLIAPPYPFRDEESDHLGLGYIESYLRSKGHNNIEIFKLKEMSSLNSKIESFRPDYVGISVPFTKSYPISVEIARIIKETKRSIKVIMGGVHPSACSEEVIKNEDVDFVVKGEGEIALEHILEGEADPVVEYPVEDLDSLPFPTRSFVNKNRVGVITSRGCPFNCSFCSVKTLWGNKWRARSPENVLKEILALNASFISFEDDNLTLNRDRAISLFSLIKRDCKIKWNTPNGIHVGSLDWDLLKLMKESGCHSLNLAIESGDDYIRNQVIGKNLSREKIIEVVNSCKDLGILTLGYFVIGMPSETMDSMNRSLELAKELMLDSINVFIAVPYPGSTLYKICVDNDYLRDNEIETPSLKTEDVKKFKNYFIEDFKMYHNAHSMISTEKKHEMIRRPV